MNKTKDIDIRDSFFDALYDIASKDSDVILLVSDMGAFSLEKFRRDLSDQYVNVGIAEQNLINIATGLALDGKKVFVYAIAPFVTQRCYEQLKVNLSGMNLPIVIVGMGPGITYSSDGLTHFATQDIANIRALPNFKILSISDPISSQESAKIAYKSNCPIYIRLDKGVFNSVYCCKQKKMPLIKELREGKSILLVTTGVLLHKVFSIALKLEAYSLNPGVLDFYQIKPVDEKKVVKIFKKYDHVVVVEEHSSIGGLGSLASELIATYKIDVHFKHISLGDKIFENYGNREWYHKQCGLDENSLITSIKNFVQKIGISNV